MAKNETTDKDDPGIETDERFPTGPWTGFFLQPNVYRGRCRMTLSLAFAAGRIQGAGADIVGKFVMTGRYDLDSGECWITKTYSNGSDIHYRGYNEDSKGIWGVWEVGEGVWRASGGYHLWPKGMADPTGSTLHAECREPRGETVSLADSGLADSQAELIKAGSASELFD